MRVLVSVMPFAGHVAPVTGVVAELLSRGHEVTVYTGSAYRERFEALGARVNTWTQAPDFDEHDLAATFPGVGRFGPAGLLANVELIFIRTGEGQARDLVAENERAGGYDVLIGDVMSSGTGLAAELTGLPWATLSIVPLSHMSVDLPPTGLALHPGRGRLGRMRDAALRRVLGAFTGRLDRARRDVRTKLGLPAPTATLDLMWHSPQLVVVTGAPSIEYPRSDLGPQFHFVGRLVPAGAQPSVIAPSTAPEHPRVIVTQGTFNTDPSELIQPALTALAERPVTVLATTGRRGVTEVGVTPPSNAEIVDFASFAAELATASAFVTNGGWGGTLEVLASGVPLVVAGGDLDKPEIAARVAWSGAGIDLRTGRPSARAVARAVDRVLADPSYRARAQAIARELAALGGARAAVDLVEALIS